MTGLQGLVDAHPVDATDGWAWVALVVPRPAAAVTGPELVEFLRSRIAAYKIPVRIHVRSELPLTASGKISRHDLHESTP